MTALTPAQMQALTALERETGTRWLMTVGGEGGIFLSGRATSSARAEEDLDTRGLAFLQARAALLQLSDAYAELSPVEVQTDGLGYRHARFNQHVNGVPVHGGGVSVAFDPGGAIVAVSGRHLPGAPSVSTAPRITQEAALSAARARLFQERPEVGWSDVGAGTSQLKIYGVGGRGSVGATPRLVWMVTLPVEGATVAPALMRYFVDAETGSVVDGYNDLHTASASGVGVKGDRKAFQVDPYNGAYVLGSRTINPTGIYIYTANEGTTAQLLTSSNLQAWDTGVYGAGAGVDAYVHMGAVYQYFLKHFGRRGIDGKDLLQKAIVHYSKRYNNAAWQPHLRQMIFGDGDGSLMIPLTGLDVVAHEMIHGITHFESGLIYRSQSGALNEATSDVLATFMEFSEQGKTAFGKTPNWLLGEDIMGPSGGTALRSLANPALRGQPDHMSKYKDLPETADGDWGGVHVNSGIINNAVYLYANGGANPTSKRTVSGIGIAKAEKIYYLAATSYYRSGTDFASAAQANLQAAQTLYGKPSAEYAAVRKGFEATGILPVCNPVCSGKACGADDGCGGVCTPGSGCASTCVPACGGKACGAPDGCGGTCAEGSGCTPTCIPRCEGKACGAANECGGVCQAGSGCSSGCIPACTGKVCGAEDGCGGTCQSGSGCGATCVPQCIGASCGAPDGCGGSCGDGSGCGEPNAPAARLSDWPADGASPGQEITVSVAVVGTARSARIVWTSPFSQRVFALEQVRDGLFQVKGSVGDPGIRRFEVIVEDAAGRQATTGVHHFEVKVP